MHGMIFSELQKYAETKHGKGTWDTLLTKANLPSKMYFPVQEYPDSEIVALVKAASDVTGADANRILQDFGQFIVPSLLKMYGHVLKKQWKTIDVIEHTEGTVHTVVRTQNPGASPPALNTMRLNPNEVLLIYSSHRRMCALAIGIGHGLAAHFGEKILVNQGMCMHKGAPRCEIDFKKIG